MKAVKASAQIDIIVLVQLDLFWELVEIVTGFLDQNFCKLSLVNDVLIYLRMLEFQTH